MTDLVAVPHHGKGTQGWALSVSPAYPDLNGPSPRPLHVWVDEDRFNNEFPIYSRDIVKLMPTSAKIVSTPSVGHPVWLGSVWDPPSGIPPPSDRPIWPPSGKLPCHESRRVSGIVHTDRVRRGHIHASPSSIRSAYAQPVRVCFRGGSAMVPDPPRCGCLHPVGCATWVAIP